MPTISPEEMILQADRMNLRLEIVRGIPIWEASPVYAHQAEIDRIRASIQPLEGSDCGCVHAADVLFRFPDGSLKRPDIAVLCRSPQPSEGQVALTQIPEAVIEVISEGYEQKDLELAPPFYLSMGVQDVLIYDPQLKQLYHHRRDGKKRLNSPVRVELECGCVCEV
ncbi:MAG: Uma2 family endonuclease [Meiothermus sp.]|nr:Uma2 family endonuclease [Meiothermus sp.]